MTKLHLGCGNEILEGWVNHDAVQLPGVDVVHDLTVFPWPFESDTFKTIRLHHLLEHLPDTLRTLEEIHRVAKDGATIEIRVPYWNSRDMATDPTHRVAFSEHSFDYFDAGMRHGRERPYYSSARFHIDRIDYWTNFGRYRLATNATLKRLLALLARHLCGMIWVLEVRLRVAKGAPG